MVNKLKRLMLFSLLILSCDMPPESVTITFIPDSLTQDLSTIFFQFVDSDVTTLQRYFFIVVQDTDGNYLSGVDVAISSGIAAGQFYMGSELSDSPIYLLDTNFQVQNSPMVLTTDRYGRILFGISIPWIIFNNDSASFIINVVASVGTTVQELTVTLTRTAISSE